MLDGFAKVNVFQLLAYLYIICIAFDVAVLIDFKRIF